MVEVSQHDGRAFCNPDGGFLFVIFHEARDHNVTLDEYNKGDPCNPDRPRDLLKSSSGQRERAPFSYLKLVKSATCLRAEFASYLADTSPSWYW